MPTARPPSSAAPAAHPHPGQPQPCARWTPIGIRLAIDTALAVDLLAVAARINRLANQRVRTRLPYARARLLSVIEEHGPARVCDLAALDYCSQPTTTTQVRLPRPIR
jgi:hypothetical protein